MSKAQGLSLNAIVLAALVLIVLVVLVMIFTGRMGILNVDIYNASKEKLCSDSGGKMTIGFCPTGKTQILGRFSDIKPGQVCCQI
ncbi:MAG: hypothetical protein ABIG95_00920 [Candidatus Woesearchaeota archaeon]